jgi:outer membrane protein OmpA-like peptidoglycan-associated protein
MRQLLLASVALAGMALAAPALAQLPSAPATPPVTPPPVQTPQPEADVTTDSTVGAAVQAPNADATAAATANAEAQGDSAGATAGADVTGSAQAQTQAPDAAQRAEGALSGAPEATQGAVTATPEAQTSAAVSASAGTMCQPRTTSVNFGARSSVLSQENRNTIEYAIDAASVCALQSVTIVDSAQGSLSARRAQAVRSTLIRQGVPADRITVSEEANAGAETGQLDVRMAFVGVANADTASARNEESAESPSS